MAAEWLSTGIWTGRDAAEWVLRPGRGEGTTYFYRRTDGTLFKARPAELGPESGVFSSSSFLGWAPLKAYVDLTNRCNLACRHCITDSSPAVDTSVELTGERIVALVGELARIGVLEVGVAGGEPFLHPAWAAIMREVTAQGMNLIVTTNGLLLDDAVIEQLRSIRPFDVRVSFDGGEAFHDRVRGKGTYRASLAGMAALVRAGIPTTARLTLCKGGEVELPALFDDLRGVGVRNVKVALAKPSGRGATPSGRHLVVDEVDPEILKTMEAQSAERGLRLTLAADDFEVEVTDGSMSKLRDVDRPNCGAGYETCHITPRGELLACSAIRNLPFGTLATRSFLDVWEGHVARSYRDTASATAERRLCDAVGDPSAAAPIPLRRKTPSVAP